MKLHSISQFSPQRLKRIAIIIIPRRLLNNSKSNPFENQGFSPRVIRSMERRVRKHRELARVDKYKKKLESVPVSTCTSLTVVNSGAGGLGRSVLLKTSTDKYLFNCGEGDQKVLSEVITKLGPVDNIFFTYNTWNNVGGIMGFLLSNTTDVCHSNTIVLHGPPNVDKILENTKMFSDQHVGQLAKVVWQGIENLKYEDDQLTVEYVELLSQNSRMESGQEEKTERFQVESSPDKSPQASGKEDTFTETDKQNSNGSDTLMTEDINISSTKPVMAYIIKLKPLPRRVDGEKLLALGAKSGPWIKKLVEGETVTLEDGRVVNPDDLLFEKERDLGAVVVLDCPTEDYLEPLLASQQIMELSAEDSCKPLMIVHMAPVSIIEDQRYKAFMERFDSNTMHLMLNENSPGPYVHGSQTFASVLNYLHPQIFPLLQGSVNYNTQPQPPPGNIIQGCYGLNFDIRPVKKQGFNWKSLLYFDKEAKFTEMKSKAASDALYMLKKSRHKQQQDRLMAFQQSDIDDELMKLRSTIIIQEGDKDTSEEYPEITFLGTGSAKPALQRSASAILVQMRKDEYLIMDCGEGTLLQMYQMYGVDKTHHILSNLKGIFISHLHYDHHGGLFGVLEARAKALRQNDSTERLAVFAPIPLKKWFYLYSRCISQTELQVEFIPHHIIHNAVKSGSENNFLTLAKKVLDVSEFVVMPVVHTGNSFGISIRHRNGWKLVYSGDSMPCQDLVRYGKDCDFLIHEGTFDDHAEQDALFKKHSTTSQAIDVGRKMNAKFILLTHFSQRFSKIPEFTRNFTENVGFSFDFMQLRPSQLHLIPLFKPVLDLMYGSDLQARLTNNRSRRPETDDSKAFIEEMVSGKKKADKLFVEKKQKDMEVWSEVGGDLKAKLLEAEAGRKPKGQNDTEEKFEKESNDMCVDSKTEERIKRKVHTKGKGVGKKVRKTENTASSVASTSRDLGENDDIEHEISECRTRVK